MAKPLTPEFRVSYPHLFKPQLNKLSNKEEYSVLCLFSKATVEKDPRFAALKAMAMDAITEKWGPDQKKWPKKLRSPFRKHEEKETENDNGTKTLPPGMEPGGIFLTLKSKDRPSVVNQQVQPIIDPSEFYSGCYAIASVSVYAYDQAGNCGVSFGLGNVQKVRDGDPLSGSRSKPENDFVAIAAPAGEAQDATSLFN